MQPRAGRRYFSGCPDPRSSASRSATVTSSAAYEFATGQRLASGDFEGGRDGAVAVLGKPGFTVQHKPRPVSGN